MGKIVEIKKLSFSYNAIPIFSDLSLDIAAGSIYTVLGKSGSGKSTLARILVGLEPTHDYIKIDGLYVNSKNQKEIRKSTILLLENPDSQFVGNTVLEELSYPLKKRGLKKQDILEKVNDTAKEFKINHLLEKNPHELSGGEKQLVMLVSSLLFQPKLLLLDEAFSMIDRVTKEKTWKTLKKYQKKENLTIIHFTHNCEEVLEGTDILLLANGKVSLQNKTKNALQSEKEFTSNHLALPFLADLSNKLRYYGTISDMEFNKKKLVDALWK